MREAAHYIKGIVAAAVFLVLAFGVIWVIQQFQPGLSSVTVDDITVDIYDGDEALEAALGNRFTVYNEDGTLPSDENENELQLSCAAKMDLSGVDFSAYYAEDIGSITLFNGSPADMSLDEYKEAFGENIRIYGNGDIMCAEVLEIDGKLISAEQIEADMEKYDITTGSAPTYVYMRDILGGDAQRFILLQCWFEDDECYICSFQCFEAA